jgi:two-component system LytT family response regulator
MRVLIVDDEQLARQRLRLLLSAFDDLRIVGEAEDGEQAIERIGELQPDLVLLDIQMAGCSGIEVASSLPSPRPKIIFCTAFDEYAVTAFELCAVDYLLKPVTRARLAHAIERVRTLGAAEGDTNVDRVARNPRMAPSRFLGRRGSRFLVIPQKDVVYWGSDGGLTKLYTAGQSYVMEPTLNDLERRLDPAVFCRISRTVIVNLDYVSGVDVLVGGFGGALLKTGVHLEVSRRRASLPDSRGFGRRDRQRAVSYVRTSSGGLTATRARRTAHRSVA